MRGSFPCSVIYHLASYLFYPVSGILASYRLLAGKEEKSRISERRGKNLAPRPQKPVIWVHGASVGESFSVLPLLEKLQEHAPHCSILITTFTVSAARLLRKRLAHGMIHQYSCYDSPPYVHRFLNHWKPDVVLWLESEIWPNQWDAIHKRGIPLLLLNARLSKRSFRRWQKAPRMIAQLLSYCDVIMAQSKEAATRFARLSGRNRIPIANLKFVAPAHPIDKKKVVELKKNLNHHSLWLASSTHEGEEEIIVRCHLRLIKKLPDLVTIIVPRHSDRGDSIARYLEKNHLSFARRSRGESINFAHGIYLADTMGELPLFYECVPLAFIGGSLVPHGGHNPLEAARESCAVLFGKHMDNFKEMSEELISSGAARMVHHEDELSEHVAQLLTEVSSLKKMATAALSFTQDKESLLDDYLTRILPYIPPP